MARKPIRHPILIAIVLVAGSLCAQVAPGAPGERPGRSFRAAHRRRLLFFSLIRTRRGVAQPGRAVSLGPGDLPKRPL